MTTHDSAQQRTIRPAEPATTPKQTVHDDTAPAASATLQRYRVLANSSPQAFQLQRQARTLAAAPNRTGLPHRLKSGLESLSGMSMDHVKVHYNSAKPAQLQAHAYAQGSEIHLGPGQERHLPHEAWHVVQQAQGRVQATMQMHGDTPVNDDAGLEAEADLMGAKAVGVPRFSEGLPATTTPAQRQAVQGAVQRKVEYENSRVAQDGDFTRSETWIGLSRELVGMVEGFLVSHTNDATNETLKDDPELRKAAELILSKKSSAEMIQAISRLRASSKDYGTFDLTDEQHQMLLIYELARSLGFEALQDNLKGKPDKEKTRLENQAEIADHALTDTKRAEARENHFRTSPNPGLTFTLAVLGNGASAAYYLESHRSDIDPLRTVVLGEPNPWDEQRGLKGAGDEDMHINHPMHMITPDRSRADGSNEQLAKRHDFSVAVKHEIQQSVRFVWNTSIRSVREPTAERQFYEIDTQRFGKIYAQHVVAALGAGPHLEVEDKEVLNRQAAVGDVHNVPHIMNLDEFQHHASDLSALSQRKVEATVIFVSGGNAAIDAVTRIVRENKKEGANFKLIWAQGGRGAQFLKGTDNEETKLGYEENLVRKNTAFAQRVASPKIKGNKVLATSLKQADNAPKGEMVEDQEYEADYFVQGTGQEFKHIRALFPDLPGVVNPHLAPTIDPNFNFGAQPGAAPEGETPQEYAKRQETFRTTQQAISGYERRAVWGENELHSTATSLRFIGASASKIATLREETKRHDANIASLPQNVIGNEQLAPIRAAQESQSGMIPRYIGREANFAVDNKTAIRLHIALKYPNISAASADAWAEVIVGQRRPDEAMKKDHPTLVGPVPNPLPADKGAPRETATSYARAVEAVLARENAQER